MVERNFDVELSVIVPVGRRHADPATLHAEYKAGLDTLGQRYELIFVLDGPREKFAAGLRTLLDGGHRFTVISLSRSFGEATALMAGFEHASGQTIVTLPAYHQIEAAEVAKLVAGLDSADVVIGQASFATALAGSSATDLRLPQSVTSDGEQLFVADTGNHRVLVWPSIPTESGAAATIVLGQGAFGATHVAPNDDDQDGAPDGVTAEAPDGVPSSRTLFAPTGVAVVDDRLAITDTGNGRVVLHLPPAAP